MTKKYNPNSPLRPRNINKRLQREKRQQHKRLLNEKETAKASGSVSSGSAADSPSGSVNSGSAADPKKVFHADTVREVKERIARMKQRITLPFTIQPLREGKVTSVLVINRDGKERELLPDRPGRHVILCHSSMAKVIVTNMCVFAKITQHERIDKDNGQRQWIDGSWSIAPCHPAMLNGTTVQHLRRRPFWFLRRYWYEISFDGRVQPGSLFYDYDIDPATRRQRLYVTHEYVPIRNSDSRNDYFRFWRYRSAITSAASGSVSSGSAAAKQ